MSMLALAVSGSSSPGEQLLATCARASRSARKLAPVMTNRSSPSSASSRSRSAHDVGRADDREAVDELRARARRCARRVLLQVLVAVVAAADLGDDLAVGLGQTRHRSSPASTEKCANAATAPLMSSRAASRSGWQPTLTYAPNEISAGSRPASAAALRARSIAHATRSGSAPTASVTRSAMRAGELDHARARHRDVERDLRLPAAIEPLQPARVAVAVDRLVGEVRLQVGDRARRTRRPASACGRGGTARCRPGRCRARSGRPTSPARWPRRSRARPDGACTRW